MAGSEHDLPFEIFFIFLFGMRVRFCGHVKATGILATLSAQKPKRASKFSPKQEGGCWMSHARMSRNARARRASSLLRSKSRLPSDLLTTQIPLSASYSGLSSLNPLDNPQGTIARANSSKNNASSCSRRPSRVTLRRCVCTPGRVWGVTCLGQRTYSFSVPALPLYTLRFYPLWLFPPPTHPPTHPPTRPPWR